MDCFNYGCLFRVNETSNANRCECTACPNKCTDDLIIVSDHTLTEQEIKRISNPNYGMVLGGQMDYKEYEYSLYNKYLNQNLWEWPGGKKEE